MIPSLDRLMERILSDQTTDWHDIHGISHWGRVHANGLKIAAESGANVQVVELFAFFHDSCRINDGYDPQHGARGAEYACQLRGDYFELTDSEFELLYVACRDHTDVLFHDHTTVQTCFDADRLDLGRVFIQPDPERMGTAFAKRAESIRWATDRAERSIVTEVVSPYWHQKKNEV